MSGSLSPGPSPRAPAFSTALAAALFLSVWYGGHTAAAQQPVSVVFDMVRQRAQALAASDYAEPEQIERDDLPADYDAYRKLAFNRERALWHGSESGFEVQFLPAGWLFRNEVKVWIVENGASRPAQVTAEDFLDGRSDDEGRLAFENGPVPLSGFRINWPLNQPDKADEVVRRIRANVDRARAGEITPEEFERAKQMIIAMHAQENTTIAAQARQAALDELYGLGYDYDQRFDERIGAVTLEQVIEAARETFGRYVLVTTSPEER